LVNLFEPLDKLLEPLLLNFNQPPKYLDKRV